MALFISPPYSSLLRSNGAGEAAGLSQAAVMPPQARRHDTPRLMTCDRQGEEPTGSTAFPAWHQISTETSPGSHRDSVQGSALWFSPAVRPGEVLHRMDGDVHGGSLQPPQRTVISTALAGPTADGKLDSPSHPPMLSFPSTYFKKKNHKKVLSNPFLFKTVWRQSPSPERRPSRASERGTTVAPMASLPPSASASSSLQKGVRGGGGNPVIPQPPKPRPRQETSHFTEESSEESWQGVWPELSLSPLSGSYLK